MSEDRARELLRAGELGGALSALQEQVRKDPSNAKLRVFLFQLLCVLGSWERAGNQLEVAAELDPLALAMAQMYREALKCERLRAEVFAGRKSPLVFGEPEEWLALLIEALLVTGAGAGAGQGAGASAGAGAGAGAGRAGGLRAKALEMAPATGGTVNGEAFEWVADADTRLGPVCEAIINGRYYWVPFNRLARIDIEPPADLRDVAWMPAHLQFANGGEAVAIIPTRYPGSESSTDAQVQLARKTLWLEVGPEEFQGLGQRLWTTDVGEYALFDVRSVVLGAGEGA
jgi:type VI secretion system protein ImpE